MSPPSTSLSTKLTPPEARVRRSGAPPSCSTCASAATVAAENGDDPAGVWMLSIAKLEDVIRAVTGDAASSPVSSPICHWRPRSQSGSASLSGHAFIQIERRLAGLRVGLQAGPSRDRHQCLCLNELGHDPQAQEIGRDGVGGEIVGEVESREEVTLDIGGSDHAYSCQIRGFQERSLHGVDAPAESRSAAPSAGWPAARGALGTS